MYGIGVVSMPDFAELVVLGRAQMVMWLIEKNIYTYMPTMAKVAATVGNFELVKLLHKKNVSLHQMSWTMPHATAD